jgi:hypothetical protein
MVDFEAIIRPFIPSLKRGTPVEVLLEPIMAENPNIDKDSIRKALLSHVSPIITQAESKPINSKPKIDISKYRDTLTRKQYQKVMESMTELVEIVDNSGYGISKTKILVILRRDSTHWRPKYTQWLHELCDMGVIKSDYNGISPLYYSHDAHIQNREREVHRRVAEALQIYGQMTMTQLAIKVGRNGGSNRPQVLFALEDLEREGFVNKGNRSRWAWTI